MAQHEITNIKNLLNKQGNIAEPGWCRQLLPRYDRTQIKSSKFRIKEWDYYLVTNGKIGLALTIADNGYMGMDSISFLNFEEKWEITKSPMRIFPMGNTGLPASSKHGDVAVHTKNYHMEFKNNGKQRILSFLMENFKDEKPIKGQVFINNEPDESMVICTPFDAEKHFYYNQKINCMHAKGYIELGDDKFEFDVADSVATLDWGRGVWTYHNTWYWGSASGKLDGVDFGWNIGYGFGNTSAASENVLFYKGKAHKLDQVTFHIPDGEAGPETGFLMPWKFSSNDGRFEMDFTPVLDRSALTDFKVLKSDQHQVFGHFTGHAILDDGTKLQIKDFFGFAEKVENKW